MSLGIEVLVAEVEVVQPLDGPDVGFRVLAVAFAAVSAGPGAVEILEGHVGHQQSQHLLGLVAHMGIAGVVGKGYVGGAVLGDVTGRVVLVVAVDGRAGDHAQDPATGLVAQDLGRQAVPQQLLVGPALCPQQAADIVHEPVIFRIAAHQ